MREVLLVVLGVGLTALCAQASVPWQPVPFTLQTLAVTLIGLTFGANRALVSMTAYLGLGAAGVPLFAGASSGLGILAGSTAGYLFSFLVVAWALGFATERNLTQTWQQRAIALILANTAILAIGAAWLSRFVGPSAALAVGVAPFISGAFAKSVIVWALLPKLEERTPRS
jgi:biotin transport system substrate-specific component